MQDNLAEETSGVKGENAVKIYGEDLNELDRLAKELKEKIEKIPSIKDYIINIEALAYVQIEKDAIAFSFSFHSEALSGQHFIRLERGLHLQNVEFEQVKEFALDLPKLDRVIVL